MVKSARAGGGSLIVDMEIRIEISESVAAIFAKKIKARRKERPSKLLFQ